MYYLKDIEFITQYVKKKLLNTKSFEALKCMLNVVENSNTENKMLNTYKEH